LAEGKTVAQVSNYLGFSERAAFDRAFKKWQGITASRFQEDYLSSGVQVIDLLDGKQLPSLPVVANQLLAMINHNNYQMDELSQLVEQDPALTAKLLALASSAMYGVVKIATIREAVVRVFGVDMLRNLALAMLANDCFDTRHCPEFCLKTYWVNALATGQLASELAKAGANANADDGYLLGLLHNIGTLLLVQLRPQDMAQVLVRDDLAVVELTEKCAAEQAALGTDACIAGAMLAVFWHLPDYLGVAIRELTNPAYRGERHELVQLVAACEHTVRLMSQGSALPAAVEQRLADVSGLSEEVVSALLLEFSGRFEVIETAAAGLV
jgi:HD-like signal output (HDOD) protein